MSARTLGALAGALGAVGVGAFYVGHRTGGDEGSASRPEPTNAAAALNEAGGAAACGHERWAVKTLTDAGAKDVDFAPVPSTITSLASIPAPAVTPDLARQPEERK